MRPVNSTWDSERPGADGTARGMTDSTIEERLPVNTSVPNHDDRRRRP
jgi:hypothetical protein